MLVTLVTIHLDTSWLNLLAWVNKFSIDDLTNVPLGHAPVEDNPAIEHPPRVVSAGIDGFTSVYMTSPVFLGWVSRAGIVLLPL